MSRLYSPGHRARATTRHNNLVYISDVVAQEAKRPANDLGRAMHMLNQTLMMVGMQIEILQWDYLQESLSAHEQEMISRVAAALKLLDVKTYNEVEPDSVNNQ